MLSNWKYEAGKYLENFQITLVWMLPKWLVKWAVIRMWSKATTVDFTQLTPDEVTIWMALKAWDNQVEA